MSSENDYQKLSFQSNKQLSPPFTQLSPEAETANEELVDLGWVFAVLRRRALIMAGIAIMLTGLAGSFIVVKSRKIPIVYQGSFKLLIEPPTAQGRLAELFLSAKQEGAGNINQIKVEKGLVDYETQIRVLRSPKLMNPVIEEIQEKYPGITYRALTSNLKINQIKYGEGAKQGETKILSISYQALDPELIQFILEKIADAYLDYSFQERLKSITQGLVFIDQQLPKLQSRVDSIQEEIQLFRQQHNLIEPEVQNKDLSNYLQNLELQLLKTAKELAEKQTLYDTWQKELDNGNFTAILGSRPEYKTLLEEWQKIESKLAIESARLREDSLPLQAIKEKQQNLNSFLRQETQKVMSELAAQIEVLEAGKNTLNMGRNDLNQQLQEWPIITREYTDLQREMQIATNSLNQFLSKREALQIDSAQQQIPWELIDPPSIPTNSSGSPLPITQKNTKRQLMVAAVLSFLLSLGFGFLIEILDAVYHTPKEVRNATKLPILGAIPIAKELKLLTKKSNKFVAVPNLANVAQSVAPTERQLYSEKSQEYNRSPVSEAFESLYTNISSLGYGKAIHSLVITSATTGDGKSTIAVRLAQTAASIGQRVLLVDADMRQPTIHTKLGLPNIRGFSDAISSDLSLNDAIQRSPSENNLFVLTAGQIPPDPIRLLSSKKRQYLMEQFQAFFDLVIYDTPPMLGLADSPLMAANTDGAILVVRLEKTSTYKVKEALDGFMISGGLILGVVANGIKSH